MLVHGHRGRESENAAAGNCRGLASRHLRAGQRGEPRDGRRGADCRTPGVHALAADRRCRRHGCGAGPGRRRGARASEGGRAECHPSGDVRGVEGRPPRRAAKPRQHRKLHGSTQNRDPNAARRGQGCRDARAAAQTSRVHPHHGARAGRHAAVQRHQARRRRGQQRQGRVRAPPAGRQAGHRGLQRQAATTLRDLPEQHQRRAVRHAGRLQE